MTPWTPAQFLRHITKYGRPNPREHTRLRTGADWVSSNTYIVRLDEVDAIGLPCHENVKVRVGATLPNSPGETAHFFLIEVDRVRYDSSKEDERVVRIRQAASPEIFEDAGRELAQELGI